MARVLLLFTKTSNEALRTRMTTMTIEAKANDLFIACHLAVLVNRQNGKFPFCCSHESKTNSICSVKLESLKATSKYLFVVKIN